MLFERDTTTAFPEMANTRALVYSLGIEGRDLARWLLNQGATVWMSDSRTAEQLEIADAYPPEGVERTIRGELLDPKGFDLLAVSQSVLKNHPHVERARELGIPIISQMALALQLCRGQVVGITGSSGKSTTTALVGEMAEHAGIEHLVGGNLGGELLDRIEGVPETTKVILEISHTQLQYTDRSPAITATTNVTPNHLDQFSWPEYIDLKRNILRYQGRDDLAILNADDKISRDLRSNVRGQLAEISLERPISGNGAWLEGDEIMSRWGGSPRAVANVRDLRMPGRHNLANALMAVAIGEAMHLQMDSITTAIRSFPGLPHRLEVIGRAHGATWINDSIATSPERTVAALNAISEPTILLLGGREKSLPLERLNRAAANHCRGAICFGEASINFSAAMTDAVETVVEVETLAEAVEAAASMAQQGDAVLLAPAGTSVDAFPRFEARGEAFRALVRALEGFEEVSS